MDTQRLIAELDAERVPSQRLELQIGELLGQVAALTRQVAELTERLGQNSRNSHRPPSSDPPGAGAAGGRRARSAVVLAAASVVTVARVAGLGLAGEPRPARGMGTPSVAGAVRAGLELYRTLAT